MSSTTTYGYKLPADGDLGSTFWNDLEDDISRLDAHTHNGTNSPKITAASVNSTRDAAAITWAVLGGAEFRATITVPAGIVVPYGSSTGQIPLFIASNEIVFLKWLAISTTQYYVYSNDNTLAFTVFYIS